MDVDYVSNLITLAGHFSTGLTNFGQMRNDIMLLMERLYLAVLSFRDHSILDKLRVASSMPLGQELCQRIIKSSEGAIKELYQLALVE